MAFFGNNTVNRVYLHYAIHALANGMGGVFLLVYLVRAGVSVPHTLLTLAAILLGRFVLRPMVLPLAKRFGLKPMVILGSVLCGVQFPLLAEVDGVGTMLVLFVVAASIGEVFYWTCYHAYFTAVGDSEHRGHQISAREAVAAVVGIIAPLLGAWALIALGPRPAFAAVGLIQALSAVPLLKTPNIAVKQEAPGAFRAARLGVMLFLVDGWFAATYLLIWQVALFMTLGESFSAYGGAMALSALVGAIAGMFLGRHIDAGYGLRAVAIAFALTMSVVVLRAVSLDWPLLAVTANALGALVTCVLVPTQMTPVYNMAKSSPCPLRFHIATEGGWDTGCFTASLLAAGLVTMGVSLAYVILLAAPALMGMAWLLRGYYLRNAVPIDAEVAQPMASPIP